MNKKLLGEERRNTILQWLKEEKAPISGSQLAKRTNVSRQVIVGDMTLLKAKKEPILATSQGYLYLHKNEELAKVEKIITCQHLPSDTKKEIEILVDHGIFVKDVLVEHTVYGYISAQLHIGNRSDLNHFLEKMDQTQSLPLSNLTNGIHLHTIVADTEEQITKALIELRKEGILVEE
jgi:transcriptional regulator of NAD metabolism